MSVFHGKRANVVLELGQLGRGHRRRMRMIAAAAGVAVATSFAVPAAQAQEEDETYFLLRGAGFYGQTLGLGDAEEGLDAYGGEASVGFGRESWLGFNEEGDSRIELEYRYLTGDEGDMDWEESFHDITLNYVEVFGSGQFRPLVGVGVGPSLLRAEGEISGFDIDISENGLMGQVFGGLNVELSDNVGLEFRLNYAYRAMEIEEFGQSVDADMDTLTLSAGVVFRL